MRHRLAIVLLVCLTVASPAEAKQILSAKVCGANGCETSRDRALISGLADGGDPVHPPEATAPFFRVGLTVGEESGHVMDRFWTHFMPKGELIRGSDGTWMHAGEAYTGALKKIVTPRMDAYPGAGLAKLLAGDQPVPTHQAQASSVLEPPQPPPAAEGRGIAQTTIGLVVAGSLAVAALALVVLLRRKAGRPRA